MVSGAGWRLASPNKLVFKGTLVETLNIGKYRLAIFRVPKRNGQ